MPALSRPRARRTPTRLIAAATVLGTVALGSAWATSTPVAAAGCGLDSRFGRMFPSLAPASWPLSDLAALANRTMEDVHVEGTPLGAGQGTPDEMKDFPVGYNYAGQFLDHDIVATDRANDLLTPLPLSSLVNGRTPALDLDSVYGNGPAGSPGIYEADGMRLKLGAPLKGAESDHRARDLVRDAGGRAVIGDPRNDENQIVASLHSLVTRFHNRVVDDVRRRQPSLGAAQVLAEARKQTTWYYQWAILTDFLPRMVGTDITSSVVSRTAGGWSTNLAFYNACNGAMPIEFSAAAYRFGHSLVRNDYEINEIHDDLPVFTTSFDPNDSLVGFQPAPQDHAIDWKYFFKLRSSTTPQDAYQFDNSLVPALKLIPGPAAGTQSTVLATRNILRGQQVGLPTGQDVARAMGVPVLRDDQILVGPALGALNNTTTQAITSVSPAFAGKAPLWTYVLAEAAYYNHNQQVSGGKITTNNRRNPARLGPVGGRIVAETVVGLLKADPASILNNPSWSPDPRYTSESNAFRVADIVKVATGLTTGQATIGVDPADGWFDFGKGFTFLGLSLPKTSTVWVTNTSRASVRYSNVRVTGPNASSFRVSFNGCGIVAWLPGTSCAVNVEWKSDAGAKYASLVLDTDGAHPVVVDLKANTTGPVYSSMS